jgi:hypothetical protein
MSEWYFVERKMLVYAEDEDHASKIADYLDEAWDGWSEANRTFNFLNDTTRKLSYNDLVKLDKETVEWLNTVEERMRED